MTASARTTASGDLPAGGFSDWLRRTRVAHLNECGVDVPCGTCTACCAASYFIHVRPDETGTLARIPRALLLPAPDMPAGTMVLGHDADGRCPMLRDDACSIYEHRPLTCRTYDCRVFAAAGVAVDRASIARRARRWAFDYPDREDREQHEATRAAARFLRRHPECFPAGITPDKPANVALLAVKVADVFLPAVGSETGADAGVELGLVEDVRWAYEKFAAAIGRR